MSNNTDDLSPEEEAENVQYDRTADVSNQDDETAERAIDKDLKWTSRKPDPGRKLPALEVRKVFIIEEEPWLIRPVTATDSRSTGRTRACEPLPASMGSGTPAT